MKIVFQLTEKLKALPELTMKIQTLTLDPLRPSLGLKGSNGLYGSQEWWDSIEQGRIPLKYISGKIIKTYVVGQDPSPVDNGFTLLLKDGSTYKGGIYDYTKKADKKLFKIGATVEMVYVLDELKRPSPTGEKNYLDIVLEMAVFVDTV